MTKWYLVAPECNYGMQDLKTTEGLYLAGRILPVGAIVPLEWKGLQRVNNLYLPAFQLLEYELAEDDLAILMALWPSVRPLNYRQPLVENSRIGSPDAWAGGWYKICYPDEKRNMSSVPYAYSALCDVEGICRVGDLAHSGEIVPAAFFAGLSLNQFDRLETIGLCSDTWLSTWPRQYRVGYMRELARPVMERVGVSRDEKEMLLAKFPALSPKVIEESPKPIRKRIK